MTRAQILPGIHLDSRRALFIEPLRLLVVADLHWGYAESHRAQGNLLPEWGDDQIFQALNALLADYAPAELLWLGDSLHTVKGRLAAETFLTNAPVPVTILPGNHDAKWKPALGPKLVLRESAQAGYALHHGDTAHPIPPDAIEIIGHHHPAFAHRDGAGARLKLPAFIQGPRRWILPAFSPWAAGTPWNDHLADDETLWAVSDRRIFPVTRAHLARLQG